MGKKDIYTVKSTGESTYSVHKFDEDLNPEGVYHVSEIGPEGATMICTCPAGGRHTCRHRDMLRLFQAEERVDKGWFYSFDKKKWFPPVGE